METKDWLSLIAVLATLVVAAINLVYNLVCRPSLKWRAGVLR